MLNVPKKALETKDELNLKKLSGYIKMLSNRLPFRTKCMEQAIVARLYLNKKNVRSVIFIGIKKNGATLNAHAWLKVGDYIVTGARGHEDFKVIAIFD